MFNPLPNLDDRRWSDLVDEGVALIPVYAPEWTDHNLHDPGITIVEMLAAVTELDIFQLNQVPDRHKAKFLALVGVAPHGPRPATTLLEVSLPEKAAPLRLAKGTELWTTGPDGRDLCFALLDDVTAVPGAMTTVVAPDVTGLGDRTRHIAHGEPVPAFGTQPVAGAALYIGFSEPLPRDTWVSLAFGFGGSRASRDERKRIADEARDRRTRCGPAPNPCRPADTGAVPVAPLRHQSVRLSWEFQTASGNWAAMDAEDGTRALTLDGTVRVRVSGDMRPQPALGGSPSACFVRVSLVDGAYDAAPLLSRVVLNGVEAEQRAHVAERTVGRGDGESDQRLVLDDLPIVAGSVRIWSVESGRRETWEERRDFDASGRADRHVTVDAAGATVSFGDGEHGFAPPPGSVLTAAFATTRGSAGNIPAGQQFHLPPQATPAPAMRVTNPVAAVSGADAESLSDAAGRAVAELRRTTRAVTLADFQTLALETPGTALARVGVLANVHTAFEGVEAPGVITVVPVPHLPDRAPQPHPGTIALVRQWLERRRLVGTRVEVVAPRYIAVGVDATVQALPRTSGALLERRLVEAIDEFLHPLRGGPDRTGWPFGRDVYRAEVLQVLDRVPGVDHVRSLALIAGRCAPTCGNVCVPPWFLVSPGSHHIQVV